MSTTETAAVASATPMQYLDKAMNGLHDLGLLPAEGDRQADPIIALLNQISTLDEGRVAAIARTLSQASLFNDVVRRQVQAMEIGSRYEDITNAFNSIRDDAKTMVDQIEDGKLDTFERMSNVWMKVTRGDIAARFDKIKTSYLDVTASTDDQIRREHSILEAYQDFRGALKQSEVLALEVLTTAQGRLDAAKAALAQAMTQVEANASAEPAERARFELARDEQVRALQLEEKRYQIAKDLSDNLTISYNTSEVVMARLLQTTNAKERVYAQAVSFFSTNEVVLTALTASFTGMFGLHEGTQTVEAMKEGVSQSLEVLADIGGKVQEAAVRAGYGPTVRADAVKKLVDSVVTWQTRSHEIIEEMRTQSTRNAEEIRDAVEEGKRKLARLAEEGKGLELQGRRMSTETPVDGGVRPVGAAAAKATVAGSTHPLDEVMLAMDVVDTLRRRERLVKAELDDLGREEDLKARLRKIYAAQGIEVPDHVIEQGVAALKEGRFTYAPPPRSLATRFARIYVNRGDWGKWVGGILGVMVLAAVIHYVSFVAPDAALPDDLVRVHSEAITLAGNDRARETLERYFGAGQSALRNDDTEGARLALRELETARTILGQEYSLRIVNRPGERSGVWRIPDVNSGARNYYILVEAVDPTGRVLPVPIRNEETRETETVDIWGLRVDEKTFNAIARDKQDDGIVDRDRFGYKVRGALVPRYEMSTTGGAITRW